MKFFTVQSPPHLLSLSVSW